MPMLLPFVRNAFARITLRIALMELLGNLVIAVFAALWLQIPDSHLWQLAASLIVGAGILILLLTLHTRVLQLLRIGSAAASRFAGMRGPLLLAAWLLLWSFLAMAAGRLNTQVIERAGFWNSRLSAHQRSFLTEPRLVAWQQDAIATILWFVLPSLLLPAIIETVTRGLRSADRSHSPFRVIVKVYAEWSLWLTVAIASFFAAGAVEKLTAWHPSDSVHGELVSVALRLGTAYLLVIAIGLITLALISELLSRSFESSTHAVPPA